MLKKIVTQQIEISGIVISLSQKRIRNLHLRILPPSGEVRVSAPLRLSLTKIKEFVLKRIDWIKENQITIRNRKIVAPLKFISGENHFIFGKEFELKLFENSRSNKVLLSENFLELHVRKTSTLKVREKIIHDFYRANLQKKIPEFVAHYEPKMKVKVAESRIKKMKTRWGTCNPKDRRIWLSLELAKRPIGCLEFIVVHEMTHLLERKHNKRFFALMDKFLPDWRLWQNELKPKIK